MRSYDPQTGDILAFSGRGRVSASIKLFTYLWPPTQWFASPKISHVGIIADPTGIQIEAAVNPARIGHLPLEHFETWEKRYLLFESTTLTNLPCAITGQSIKGVQAHDPLERIANYDGEVYLCRLTDPYREKLETNGRMSRLNRMLLSRIGEPYDGRGAILSGTRIVKHWWAWAKADRSSLFCSEYIAWALAPIDVFGRGNSSKVTPANLIRTQVDEEVCLPLVQVK